ncbi:hypothetical protein [Carboxylicivirga marina]|uniref:Lipoprotein n=1 Tax=Carboxylicivirga marina TaxID=2800988 RepID=A0ABS1HI96_9BACT|nr:hypothetical protein [Carboxylicivirga marina]MBK3517386.1 hypothetical protein [Carboxylicivirga marina]
MRYILLICISVILVSCQCLRSSSQSAENVALEQLGTDATVTYNIPKTYALIYSKNEKAEGPLTPLKYMIYDVKNSKIVFEEQKRDGSVEWHNAEYVVVNSKPEVQSINREENKKMSRYYINVNTLEKVYSIEK